jgi:hypothetical protein
MSLKKDLLKYKPRKEQQDALDFIDGEYKRNPMNKFSFKLTYGVGKVI